MAIRTFGPNAVDWEQRIDLDRLRTERLDRLREELERSDLGALCVGLVAKALYDLAGQRYWTATGPLPTLRESQSNLNTAGRYETATIDA